MVVLEERTNPMANEPAEDPPWFFVALLKLKLPPLATEVAVVDRAVITRSGSGTVTCVDEHSMLLVSSASVIVLPESAFAQT